MKIQNLAGPANKLGRQLGVSLIEVLGAVAIGAVTLMGVADQTNTYVDKTKDSYTAEHMRMYAQAARAFVKENKFDTAKLPPGVVKAFDANDVSPYLPAGFAAANKNPYGQEPRLVLKRKNDTVVEGYLIYTRGREIEAGRRQFVGVMAGVGGGFVSEKGVPQGSGWSDDTYPGQYGKVVPATPGRAVVSLNLLEPTDQLDPRYLCLDPKNPDCNKLTGDLNVNNYAIKNVREITSDNRITINAPVTFEKSVSIVGNLTASTLAPTLQVSVGDPCTTPGAIAQLLAEQKSGDKGIPLTCREGRDGRNSWQTILAAREEAGSIYGCNGNNKFCETANLPESTGFTVAQCTPWSRTNHSGRNVGTGDEDIPPDECWNQKKIFKGRTFCSIGMVSIGNVVHNDKVELDKKTKRGFDHVRNDGTFCRVKSDPKNPRDWTFTIGTAMRVPIACHLVCLD